MSVNLNTTMNGTQSSSCSNPTSEKIGKTFAYCLLSVVALAGNSFIGIIVYKTKTMRKPINYLIVNMAMSDLLFPIFLYPEVITYIYVDSWLISGPLGQALCKLCPFLTGASNAVSIQSLVLIAVDRLGAVVFPLRSPIISSKMCPSFILATWIVAMAFNSPYLFTNKLVEYPGRLACEQEWNEVSSFQNHIIARIVILFYIPLMLIAVLYIIIVIKLKSQKTPGEQSVNAGQQRAKRERNVLRLAIAIVLGFAVCWLPLTIIYMVVVFASDNMTWSCGFYYFIFVIFFIANANCAINPCICLIFSGNFRQGLKNLLRCFSVVPSRNQVTP